jgi:hypothetical protein
MKLNVGAGGLPLVGYTPVDRKLGSEAYPLAYPDGSAEEIRASHVLEHFDWRTVPKVLADWYRVLKPGGILKVAVPDMTYIANHLDDPKSPFYLMGGQSDANDFHRSAFTRETLSQHLTAAGFVGVGAWPSDAPDCSSLPCSLNLCAMKAGVVEKAVKIQAVMSMPRLAFAENMFCAVTALGKLGINLTKVEGAFWGQCIERGLSMHLEDGTDWLLTIDYDSIYTPEDLEALIELMANNPDADAIAPLQCRREEDYAIWTHDDANGNRKNRISELELRQPLMQVTTAHFGLTLIRVDALRRLKHPWFIGTPNKDGQWGEGRVDDDIYFWHKFRDAGNKLYLANHVRIGHLQLMASWPDDVFKPVHQYLSAYRRDGAPRFTKYAPVSPFSAAAPSSGRGGALGELQGEIR